MENLNLSNLNTRVLSADARTQLALALRTIHEQDGPDFELHIIRKQQVLSVSVAESNPKPSIQITAGLYDLGW